MSERGTKTCQHCCHEFPAPSWAKTKKQFSDMKFCSRVCSAESKRGQPGRIKHGHSPIGYRSPTYRSWYAMIHRCTNPNSAYFKHYGGRGISVCERWRESFVAFLEDMGERPDSMTIDRINNDGNYEPSNCRWATPKQQAMNTRLVRLVDLDGETLTQGEAAKRLGVSGAQFSTLIRTHGLAEAISKARTTWSPGKLHPNATLTESHVAEIKRRLASGERVTELAVEFGVTQSAISGIKLGKNWTWVEAQTEESK